MVVPGWWFAAAEVNAYHKKWCDWRSIGVTVNHCSCGLTRAIARLLEPVELAPLPPPKPPRKKKG